MASLQDSFDSLTALYTADEESLLKSLIKTSNLTKSDRAEIESLAARYVENLRGDMSNIQLMDSFLLEYDLSSQEGLTLMRLAEALIRTPDFETSRLLMRDKLSDAEWASHARQSRSFLVNQATSGLRLTKTWIEATGGVDVKNLAARIGDRGMELGVARAMSIMGQHFVLGRDIVEAVKHSQKAEAQGFSYSYDMLGEAAYTQSDAEKYFQAYLTAIEYLSKNASANQDISTSAGISIKLSALHPRYEYAKRQSCVPPLLEKIIKLAEIAKAANLSLTIDAEECDRLEVSLLIFDQLLKAPSLSDWGGLGIVVQSYQRRATATISWLIKASRAAKRRITVRLVKGAYWDMEIKRAQELGLESYPVFTRKENTDISYIACARLLLDAENVIYPQFATHNALTAASIVKMARASQPYEFQRLHGMGEGLHQDLMQETGVSCRIYAPVGQHKDLLPYLVRRLLENGANSSFVNQQFDEKIPVSSIIQDPFELAAENPVAAHPKLPAPTNIFGGVRHAGAGWDVTQSDVSRCADALAAAYEPYEAKDPKSKLLKRASTEIYNPAKLQQSVGRYVPSATQDIDLALKKAKKSKWPKKFTTEQRADCLEKFADSLEEQMESFLQLCTLEAGKTYLDGVAEVREAVDFCRYYAQQARRKTMSRRQPLGIIACISPWNFPLAIFIGQIAASLAVGNTVIAKPAEQTPLIAHKAITLLYAAGVPKDAVHLIMGDGALLGSHLTHHQDINGVCFTGSTKTAKIIAKSLADTNRSAIPFIAETGGLNAMIVDSTALLEQAVQDVLDSAFQSAGQRCSACRLVCIQEDIAEDFINMLSGAMADLTIGDPALLSTDIGPVIDKVAHENIAAYIDEMSKTFKVIGSTGGLIKGTNFKDLQGHFISPIAFEIEAISQLTREIFGPVLHVVRFKAEAISKTIDDINALGFGLTMGLHSRLDSRVKSISKKANVGNLYINRNQIGAVVGVQPFGGEGLSGTGPKAGGPHYLMRLSAKEMAPQHSEKTQIRPALSLTHTSPSPETMDVIHGAKAASQRWVKTMAHAERLACLNSIFSNDGETTVRLALSGMKMQLELPGPTGETNTLTLHPRGVILCMGEEDDITDQMKTALAMGNSVIVHPLSGRDSIEACAKAIEARTGINNLITLLHENELNDILNGPIDGAAIDGALRNTVGEFLCRRPGTILPLLSAASDPYRYCHERTITNNTTAAGGNASLLTMV
ncbi:bifunctional proline dehydrogenase/L-glutamate gamma-semialdehyde dehydrogenase PutA [Hellea balneolensis]|uniref:bifunctional proline dehydrogenase/L-glutamate gamma-semialdehyde dehydrogenase PutA n=1 Tax=Hellea balneolensis TaxID=287478 RepID=UPI000407FB99|nr:bifunctional proline dehydrogenase/L-glutamate gamma-semialdehyde dehydrogenase PutA [Hellea balneolensis]